MHCTRVEHDKDFISGDFDDPTRPVTGCEPTNQRTRGLHTFTYFNVFTGLKLKGMETELNWLAGCDVEEGCAAVAAGCRATCADW